MKSTAAALIVAFGSIAFVGCASRHEDGVSSTYRSQSVSVMANTTATTEAAKEVLNDRELVDVSGKSTKVDGMAMGKMADGTNVNVAIERDGETMSDVSVTVGTLGDPKLGADIAKAIKVKAEGMKTGTGM